jgi:hypothetical protein
MLRLAIVLGAFLVLFVPGAAHAAPRSDILPCALEVPGITLQQRLLLADYEQFDAPLTLDGMPMTLHMCAPATEARTAGARLRLMADALPYLSAISGLPYDGPSERWVLLLPDGALPPNVLGNFSVRNFIIGLSPSSGPWTAVHEVAHYLANDRNFSPREPWMAEGFADYLTERTMIALGRSERMDAPDRACARLSLMDWAPQMDYPLVRCAYDAGGAVFRDLAQRAGDEVFQRVTRAQADSGFVNSWQLLDDLERSTAIRFDDIFRHQVIPARYDETLDRRIVLWQQLDRAIALAGPLGVTIPPWPEKELRNWQFDEIGGWLGAAARLLETTSAYAARCGDLGLACDRGWSELPQATYDLDDLTRLVSDRQAQLESYAPLHALGAQLNVAPPEPIASGMAGGQPGLEPQIERALVVGRRGLDLAGQCAAIDAPCLPTWQAAWSRGDLEAANQAIGAYERLLAAANGVEAGCGPDLLTACRNYWHTALGGGALDQAGASLDNLAALLRGGAALEQRCATYSIRCQAWRSTFATSGADALRQSLRAANDALDVLDQAYPLCKDVMRACQAILSQDGDPTTIAPQIKALGELVGRAATVTDGCVDKAPCIAMWQNAVNSGQSPQQVDALLRQLAQDLPLYRQARAVQEQSRGTSSANQLLNRRTAPMYSEVEQAIAAGDLKQAQANAQMILDNRADQQKNQSVLLGIASGAAVLLAGAAAWRFARPRRRHTNAAPRAKRRPAAPLEPDELLAGLMAQAPPSARQPPPNPGR